MDFLSSSDDEDVEIQSDSEVEDSDFEMNLLKTKLRIRVKKNGQLKKVFVPRDSVKNIEIDFYNFDEHLAAFITSFPNLRSIMLLAIDDDFFNDEFIAMAAGLPALSKLDIRIWQKLDRFDYNEYNIEDSSLDTVYQLMNQCSKLKLVKVLSKFDFRFNDLDDYDSVGSDGAKKTLRDFGNKLNTQKPRWKFTYEIPVIDHNGTGYSYSIKK